MPNARTMIPRSIIETAVQRAISSRVEADIGVQPQCSDGCRGLTSIARQHSDGCQAAGYTELRDDALRDLLARLLGALLDDRKP